MLRAGALIAAAAFVPQLVDAAWNCDAEHGAHCPEAFPGPELASCLSAKSTAVSDDCQSWLDLMSACEAELDTAGACGASPEDAFICLTAWTPAAQLSEQCRAKLPEKPKPKEPEVVSSDKKKKGRSRAQRRRAEQAAYYKAKAEDEKKEVLSE